MREFLKKNQAITLVSLVVTIIILIILAGVSLNLTLGQNGIITKAKQAKENTELAKIEEETALNELYMQMESEGGITGDISYDAITKLVEFKREIASAISDMGIATAENADASTMASNIRSLSGASSADKVSYDNKNSGLEATNIQGAIDEVNNSLTFQKIYSGSISSINVNVENKTELRLRLLLSGKQYTPYINIGTEQTDGIWVLFAHVGDNNAAVQFSITDNVLSYVSCNFLGNWNINTFTIEVFAK